MTELELRLAYHTRILAIMQARRARIESVADAPLAVKEEAEMNVLRAQLEVAILESQVFQAGLLESRQNRGGTNVPPVGA